VLGRHRRPTVDCSLRGIISDTVAERPRIVLDTNVVVAGLRSRRGASFRLLSEVGRGRFEIALSVPLVLEYEDALLRQATHTQLTRADVHAVLNYFCSVGHLQSIFFLWRPLLPDPKDDCVLELAVAAGCQTIVTFNLRDFREARGLGISVQRPVDFLRAIGVLS
jgi:putative PIN family toxin of toxin-antitoxin system